MGRSLVTCLLAHLVWSDPEAIDISLATFAAAIAVSEEEILHLLAHIRTASRSPMARRLAATLMKCKAEETFSGVFLNAVKGVEWLFTIAYADLVSEGDFDPRALLIGNTTVFLNISLRTLETTPPIARVLVGALLNTVYMADGWTRGRILFLLDEAARLGRMKTLETARDIGRKYGVSLHMLFQSVGQMAEAWGREGTRAWIDAAAWVGYAAIRAGGAGKDLSDQLGAHGVLAWSEGDNQGRQKPFGFNFGSTSRGINVNVHEIRRVADRRLRDAAGPARRRNHHRAGGRAPAPHRPGDLFPATRNDCASRNQPFRQRSSGVNPWPISQPGPSSTMPAKCARNAGRNSGSARSTRAACSGRPTIK